MFEPQVFKHAVTRLKPQVSASSMLQICSELKEMTLLASRLLRLAFFHGFFQPCLGCLLQAECQESVLFFAGFKTLQIQDTELSCKTGGSVLLFLFADDMICWSSLSPLCNLRHADVFHTSIHITVSLCVIKAPCLLQCHVCWTSFDASKRTRGVQGFKDDQCDPRSPQFGTEYTKVLPDGFIIN